MNVEYRNGTSSFIIRYSILNSFKLATLRSSGEPHLATAFKNSSNTCKLPPSARRTQSTPLNTKWKKTTLSRQPYSLLWKQEQGFGSVEPEEAINIYYGEKIKGLNMLPETLLSF